MSSINVNELLERCLGIHSIMDSVLTQFRESGEEMLVKIEQQLDLGDWEEATRAAHSLKGAAGNIAAGALRALAADMETRARDNDAEACKDLRQGLRDEMNHCLDEITEFLKECNV
ncbi:MAG: Hpt domain-containing protein [Phycisphaerae bacterium]|nr:Hpt domain-containing protein [Phycisphaerae bacterium]